MTNKEATLKVKGFKGNVSDEVLAEKIGISKPTLYTRLVNENWKKGEVKIIKQM